MITRPIYLTHNTPYIHSDTRDTVRMLIKEYRIPLPMTVEEYRIAQLYMIAKKSSQESQGADAGSGVEILVNEPYKGGPGGAGQYTHKVYHIGRLVLARSVILEG